MNTDCRLILGVVGSDVHCVANQLLEVEFRNHGYAVINLGVALDEGVILQSLSGEGNEFVLLGTINGDIEPAISEIKAVRARHSKNVVIVVGGNVVLGAIGRDRTLDLIEAGADYVISNASTVSEVVSKVIEITSLTKSINA